MKRKAGPPDANPMELLLRLAGPRQGEPTQSSLTPIEDNRGSSKSTTNAYPELRNTVGEIPYVYIYIFISFFFETL